MLFKTRAIVLKNTFFGDHAVISKMYTRENGLRSYMINGVRKPKSRISMGSLQPLSLLDLEAYEKSNSGIQRIKELKCRPILIDTFQDFKRRAVAMFLIELLNSCIVAEDCEHELFDFLEASILKLETDDHISNFPLQFMVDFSRMLGIDPQSNYSEDQPYLDLQTGTHTAVAHELCADRDVSRIIHVLRNADDKQHLNMSAGLRKKTLDTLILYYQQHLMHVKRFNSTEILGEVMEAWHKV
ncbi:DNA repair protein RecO [bacterium]|nr:DNA repair protein RecO [bacterium]